MPDVVDIVNAPIIIAVLMGGRGRGRYVYPSSVIDMFSIIFHPFFLVRLHTVVDQLGLLARVDLNTRCRREPVALQHEVVIEREHAVEKAALVKFASPILVSLFIFFRQKRSKKTHLLSKE